MEYRSGLNANNAERGVDYTCLDQRWFQTFITRKKIISLRRPRRRKPHIEGRAPKTHDVNHTTVMSSNATRTTDTPTVGDAATPAHHIDAEEAFPGLPQDVVAHILRSDSDPIVLARLRAVNRAMRDAVDQTGLSVDELPAEEAAELGCLETLKH